MDNNNTNKVNYKDFIRAVASHTNYAQRNIKEVMEAMEEVALGYLKEKRPVKILPSITLSITERGARTGKDPNTKEEIVIPARNTIHTKFAPSFRDQVQ